MLCVEDELLDLYLHNCLNKFIDQTSLKMVTEVCKVVYDAISFMEDIKSSFLQIK